MHPIKNIHVRNFRSLEKASMLGCDGLNVLIGKNNAGKSSLLAALPIVFDHLEAGEIASNWRVSRAVEQFTHRETDRYLQVAVEFCLDDARRTELLKELAVAAPQLTKSIDLLKNENSVSFIFRFALLNGVPFQYIESVSWGGVNYESDCLLPAGDILLKTPAAAAIELFNNHKKIEALNSKAAAIKKLLSNESYPLNAFFNDRKAYGSRFVIERLVDEDAPSSVRRDLITLLDQSESYESFKVIAGNQIADCAEAVEAVKKSEISVALASYTGEVKVQPSYITSLCRTFGAIPILKLGERKQPIGKKEATRLLQLKVKRGGPERLQVVQQTVKALLGVNLDAFQGDGPREAAEMDVDNFLAEANGAGIRESLRMILDLELEPSDIVLLEEPEVHLHPGLEYAIHSYLQEKSKTKQIFLTTHSTNFIDTASPQQIYLVTRGAAGVSSCESLGPGDAPFRIPVEIGLRLSTVFMFDKIVFVEGPSDEAILREVSKKLGLNLNGAGVAFVHMGGVSNFTHYAAQFTLDLLSRRQIKMWFIIDKDERDESDIKAMLERVLGRADLFVLERRELENFLFDESAILGYVAQKSGRRPTQQEYRAAVAAASDELKDRVIELYLDREVLAPIYLRGAKHADADISTRLSAAESELARRKSHIEATRQRLEREILGRWDADTVTRLVPGALLLDSVCRRLGCTFDKASGDGVKLARHMQRGSIPGQLERILKSITQQ